MALSTILLIVAGVLIGFGALLGFGRGFGRSFLRLFTVLIAFLGVVFACQYFLSNTAAVLGQKTVVSLAERFGVTVLDTMKETFPTLYDTIIALPVAIASPLVFTILFVIVSFVLLIVYGIVAAFVLPKRKKTNFLSRILGFAVGAVQGAVVTVAILLPLVGMLGLVVDAVDTVEAEQGAYESELIETVSSYRDQLVEAQDSMVYKYVKQFGGQQVCDALMSFSVKDSDGEMQEVSIHDEVIVLAKSYAHAMPMIGTDMKEYTEAQALAIDKLAADIGGSELMTRLISGALSALCTEWDKGEAFLGVDAPSVGGSFDEFLTEVYATFKTSDETTIGEDLATIADLFGVMVEHGVFTVIDDADAMQEKLSEPEVMDDLLGVLRSNERTAHLANVLTRIGMKAFCSEMLQVPDEDDPNYAEYNEMVGSVADALNGLNSAAELEEMIDELSEELNTALAEYGIETGQLTETLLETVSDAMLEEFGDNLGSITNEQITQFLTGQVYAAGATE